MFEIERKPVIVSFEETAAFNETYGFAGNSGKVFLEGQYIVPKGRASQLLLIFMHPASTLNLMPLPVALAREGFHVLCAASRYAKNDTALIMEKVAADLGAYIRHAREELGYKRVVLVGWSGGGSLAAFYQSQAEKTTVTATPAGDAYDLVSMKLQPADGVMFVAAHTGRARTLSEWIDPSVIDESDPDRRNRELDLYDPAGPKAPFSADFVTQFRAAQKARIRRITDRVEETLDMLRKRGTAELERPFIVHRTMADPRFLDGALEPNQRRIGWTYMGHPETVNSGPVGLARFSTLRAWLSQWSPKSRADAEVCVADISAPLLVIENGADDAVPPSHPKGVFAAARMSDKQYHCIETATHYYREQPQELARAIELVRGWIGPRFGE